MAFDQSSEEVSAQKKYDWSMAMATAQHATSPRRLKIVKGFH